jgi:hypothetical protein
MELSDAPEKIDPGTLRLVAQCFNLYATPGVLADVMNNLLIYSPYTYFINKNYYSN